MTDHPFELRISLSSLKHLGINLYSSIPAVLSEIVANAYDADASTVDIAWDRRNSRIIIQDDGHGMTRDEVNQRFLNVGYARREGQPGRTDRFDRLPMGRKGIGKLSLFSIANVVEVHTVRNGEKNAFRMELSGIRRIASGGGEKHYHPTPIEKPDIDLDHGTRIVLSDLNKKNTLATDANLRKRVARRFSILGPEHNFVVKVAGVEVTARDRDYYDKMELLFTFGDDAEVRDLAPQARVHHRPNNVFGNNLSVRGWLATVGHSKDIIDKDDSADDRNLNRIAIFIRGKMARENMLPDFAEYGVYASYLIGELSVDGLDSYDGPGTHEDEDIATSSRQTLVESDPRLKELKGFLREELKFIQRTWRAFKQDTGAQEAMQIPEIKVWVETLDPGIKGDAKNWLGKLNQLGISDVAKKKELMKHAVLAFEFNRLHSNLDHLKTVSEESMQDVLDVFRQVDGFEATLYGQIVQGRLKVIENLRTQVDENRKERLIQEYLYNHLWLLDPSWERADASQIMERRVCGLFDQVDAKLTDEERLGRIDIKYRKVSGEHVIIELKRPKRPITLAQLVHQVGKYDRGFAKLLAAQNLSSERYSIVVVLGGFVEDYEDERGMAKVAETLAGSNARIVYYDEMLLRAEAAYREYLAKRQPIDALQKVIAAIQDYASPELEAISG